jgi:hypothetical protein
MVTDNAAELRIGYTRSLRRGTWQHREWTHFEKSGTLLLLTREFWGPDETAVV